MLNASNIDYENRIEFMPRRAPTILRKNTHRLKFHFDAEFGMIVRCFRHVTEL